MVKGAVRTAEVVAAEVSMVEDSASAMVGSNVNMTHTNVIKDGCSLRRT
jgi:uncharacterized protein (UPF0179 family)